jgi:hypothetical protein
MYTVELVADLLGTDHDRVEAIQSTAPMFAKSPLEPSMQPPMLSEHARRRTDKVSCDPWGNLVQCLVQRRNRQFHSVLEAHPLLHDPMHARGQGVEDIVAQARRPSPLPHPASLDAQSLTNPGEHITSVRTVPSDLVRRPLARRCAPAPW